MKQLINIALIGCDDSTIFDMEMTEEEYNFLQKVAEKSREVSSYSCMPIMEVSKDKVQIC